MEDKLDILIKSVNEMKLLQNKLGVSVNSLSDKLLSFTKKIDELSVQLNTLSTDNDFFKRVTTTKEEKIKTALNSSRFIPKDGIKTI